MAQAIRQRGSLTATDLGALGWVGVCAYLYAGTHAQLACHLASVVPPAFFSYALIIDRKTTHEGMRSLLFFWFLQGMLLCLDTIMGDVKGFYFGKFIVLSGMFWKAVKDNNYGKGSTMVDNHRSTALARCQSAAWEAAVSEQQRAGTFDNDYPTDATQDARSGILKLDDDIMITNRILSAGCQTALAASAALPTTFTATDRDFDELSTHTCSSFRNPAKFFNKFLDTPKAALAARCSPPISSDRMLTEKHPLPGLDLRDMSPRFPYGKLNDDNDVFAVGDDCVSAAASVMLGNGDLRTDPAGFIVIPGPQAKVMLKVENTTEQAAMFGLKCNAMERIKATPTAGVIPAGGTIQIRLCLNDNVNWPSLMGERWDKLAIDYLLCEPTVTAFDKFSFFSERSNKMRVKFNVIYRTDAGPVHGY